MKWSLVVGRFWGTEVRLHLSMLLLIPYAMVMFRPVGTEETVKLAVLLTALFACVALHELGHTFAARMKGISVNSIVLWPLGGFANLSRRPAKALDDMLISAAGPFVNLLIFCGLAVLALVELLIFRWPDILTTDTFVFFEWTFPMLVGLMASNLSLAVFNLLPVYPLDGGQITRSLIKLAFGEQRADQVMLILSLPPALGLTMLGVVLGDIVVILSGLLLMVAAISLVEGAKYPVSAEAADRCEVIYWPHATMLDLVHRFPTLAVNALKVLAGHVREFQDRYRELATERVERRVARTVLRLATQTGRKTEEGVLLDIPLTRQDLAEMSGTTLFTVSRILSQWETQGLVAAGREKVVIRFPHGLVRIAEDLPVRKKE